MLIETAGTDLLTREGAFAAGINDLLTEYLGRRRPDQVREIAWKWDEWLQALAEKLKPVLVAAVDAAGRLNAAREVAGYEPLLRDKCGHHPFMSRLQSYFLLHLGKLRQKEILAGRRVGAQVKQIASLREVNAAAISQRALELKTLCVGGHGGGAIEEAILKGELKVEPHAFDKSVEGACLRDPSACRELLKYCKQIAPFVRDPRGRGITLARTTHEMMQTIMAESNRPSRHTFSAYESDGGADGVRGDYVDPITVATRAAFNQPRFCPRRAEPWRTSSP